MTGADVRGRVFRRIALAVNSVYLADRRFVIFVVVVFVNGVLIGPFLPFLGIFVRDELGADQADRRQLPGCNRHPDGSHGLIRRGR